VRNKPRSLSSADRVFVRPSDVCEIQSDPAQSWRCFTAPGFVLLVSEPKALCLGYHYLNENDGGGLLILLNRQQWRSGPRNDAFLAFFFFLGLL
jgi:hypothetical protein